MSDGPPRICLLCLSGERFTTREHIVPESLGNDLMVLPAGWVCDKCNNICSAFESRALASSIMGLERCRLGVTTKKRKPATAKLYGVKWYSEPSPSHGIVGAEAVWDQIPVMNHGDNRYTTAVPLHDDSNADICRVLLKIGLELIGVQRHFNREEVLQTRAREFVLGCDHEPWPYFVLRTPTTPPQLVSVLHDFPEDRNYIRSCGFDIFLHQVDDDAVVVLEYGSLRCAASLSSRRTQWTRILADWTVPFVGCPIQFASIYYKR